MRKILNLALGLEAGSILLGLTVHESMFVLTAYFACIFGPVLAIGLLFHFFPRLQPATIPVSNETWPPDLNPNRRPFRKIM